MFQFILQDKCLLKTGRKYFSTLVIIKKPFNATNRKKEERRKKEIYLFSLTTQFIGIGSAYCNVWRISYDRIDILYTT